MLGHPLECAGSTKAATGHRLRSLSPRRCAFHSTGCATAGPLMFLTVHKSRESIQSIVRPEHRVAFFSGHKRIIQRQRKEQKIDTTPEAAMAGQEYILDP